VSLVRRNRRRYGGYVIHLGMALLFVGVAASSAFQHAKDVRLSPGQTARINGYDVRYDRATSRLATKDGRLEKIVFGSELTVRRDGKVVARLAPEKGYYPATNAAGLGPVGRYFEGESTSEVGLKAGVRRDVWTAVSPDIGRLTPLIDQGDAVFTKAAQSLPPAARSEALGLAVNGLVDRYRKDPPPATFRLIISPMVTWIWLGALVVFAGGLICLWPAPDAARRRVRAGYASRVARELGRA
jgi:cytochrome c-type biogenesis protein CcmF